MADENIAATGHDGAAQNNDAASAGTPAPATKQEPLPPITAPADWPADWREKASGGDERYLERLRSMNSPVDLAKSYRELELRMSQTKRVPELPAKPTPEQLAEYRKAVGVPEEPGKYNFDLGNGYVWADSDKPMLEDFAKLAHETNMPEREAKKAVGWYVMHQQKMAEEYSTKDKASYSNAVQALMKEWGPEFEANRNAAQAMISRLPEETRTAFLTARLPDGSIVGNSPEILNWAARMERELNPAATLVPSGGGDPEKGVEGRMKEIEKLRRSDPNAYWKDQGIQDEYLKLAEAQLALSNRKKRA